MKRTVSLLLATVLLLCALPALADTVWTPHQGATPEFIQGLDAQTPATGHTQTPGAWEYDHIQVGYTEVTRDYAPSRHELAALYWAANAGLFDYAYNLNGIVGETMVWVTAANGLLLHAIWAGDRIFLLTVAGTAVWGEGSLSIRDTVSSYDAAADTVSGTLSNKPLPLEAWLKLMADEIVEEGDLFKGEGSTSATLQQLF